MAKPNSIKTGSRVPDKKLKRRLLEFTNTLKTDQLDVPKDKELIKFLRKFVRKQNDLDSLIEFLEERKGSNGVHWGQGVYEYSKLVSALDEFSVEVRRPLGTDHEFYRKALNDLDDALLGEIKINPYHFTDEQDVYEWLPKKKAHAGYTFLETGKKSKASNLDGILLKLADIKSELINDIESVRNRFILPAKRCQSNPPINDDGSFNYEKEIKHKTRLVWMVDILVMLVMYEYQIPLQEALHNVDWYAGKDRVKELKPLLDKAFIDFPYFWVLDASQYDSHIQPWTYYDTRQILKKHYNLNREEELLYDACTSLLIDKKVWDGDKVRSIHGGVGSGFPSTSTDDSMMNQVQVRTALYKFGFDRKEFKIFVLGDDILILSKREFKEEIKQNFQSYLWHNFAYKINLDKENSGRIGDQWPEFLSCYWKPEGPRRCWQQTIAKAIFPERRRVYNRRKRVTPELLVLSLCQLYPIDMDEFIREKEFLDKYGYLEKELYKMRDNMDWLPGSVAYYLQYVAPSNRAASG